MPELGAVDRWPDTHDLVGQVLATGTELEYVTSLPSDLQDRLPLWRVRRIGGTDDGVTDRARVDVEAYAATYEQARYLAELGRQLLISRHAMTAAGLMDKASTEVGPAEVPYTDQNVRMFRATYRVSARRRRPPYRI